MASVRETLTRTSGRALPNEACRPSKVAVTPPMLAATAIVHATLERRPYAAFFRQAIYRRNRTPTPT